jgi:hypothetical protein
MTSVNCSDEAFKMINMIIWMKKVTVYVDLMKPMNDDPNNEDEDDVYISSVNCNKQGCSVPQE